jgi:hypothetical protein
MSSIETLIKKSGEYLETKLELTKLKAVNTSSNIISGLVYLFLKILIIFLLIGFTSVALAILIGEMLGNYYYGFFIIGGFYLLVLLVVYLQRENWIKGPIASSLIDKMLK